jgi:hypothetical protein
VFGNGGFSSGSLYEVTRTGGTLGNLALPVLTDIPEWAHFRWIANESFWVADRVTDMAYDSSESGSVLSNFATGIAPYGRITVISGNPAPERGSFILFLLGAAGLLVPKHT